MTRTIGHGTNGQPVTRHGEWWGRRKFAGLVSLNSKSKKWWKRKTHKIERQWEPPDDLHGEQP